MKASSDYHRPLLLTLPNNHETATTELSVEVTPLSAFSTPATTKGFHCSRFCPHSLNSEENKQRQHFNSYVIPKHAESVSRSDSSKSVKFLQKSNSLMCMWKPPKINKLWLETSSIFINARVLSSHFYDKIEECNKSDDEVCCEMIKKLKANRKFLSGSIALKDEAKFGIFLKLAEFYVFSGKILKNISDLRVCFSSEDLTPGSAPKFLLDHLIHFTSYVSPSVEELVEIKYINHRGYEWGVRKNNLQDFVQMLLKNHSKCQNLATLHLNFCSWFELDDTFLLNIGEFLKKMKENKSGPPKIREIALYFSGSKMTDKGIDNLLDGLRNLQITDLISLSIGFDARNDNVTDETLKVLIETVLFLSQRNTISNISLCLITKNITNHGVWCVLEGLQKIAERIRSLTLVFGNDKRLTDAAFKNFKDLLSKSKNLQKLNIGLMSSKLEKIALLEIFDSIQQMEHLDSFNLFYTNKGGKSKEIEAAFSSGIEKWNRKLREKNLQIYLD